jgi:hypothetical protein
MSEPVTRQHSTTLALDTVRSYDRAATLVGRERIGDIRSEGGENFHG